MSGHSKWAKIKHAKGAADQKKGQVFSKLAKELMVVAKQGGGALTLPVNVITFDTANPNAWTVVATVIGTNGIALTVTGSAAVAKIHWECWLRITEVRKGA